MVPMAAESAAPRLAPSLPVRRPAVSPVAQPRRRMPVLDVILFTAGWLLVVGAALLLLARYDAINRISDSNSRARQELAHLGIENQTLQQQVDELGSPERIRNLATTKLKMVPPGKMAVARVDPSLLAERPAPSLAALNPPRAVAEGRGLWQQVAAWWNQWRGGRGVARGR